ncbi:MAG TPA: class I SAM-dependent methyltransferase [Polyangiaceae bacterium]|nr:class I SAM-dependent methyltransferase [Polyangiaceae bacterium]
MASNPPAASAAPANFGRLARLYAPLEYFSFGRALSRRRRCFLVDPRVASARRALVLGDGDGRFTASLLERYPAIEITAVDASAEMLTELERRVRARTPNATLELQCADLRHWSVPHASYDLVVSHFVFDCLTTRDLAQIIARIAPALSPNARWLVSDFAIPTHALWRPIASWLVRFLYFAFGLLTGLQLTALPEYQNALKAAQFQLMDAETALGGALRSELWERLPR